MSVHPHGQALDQHSLSAAEPLPPLRAPRPRQRVQCALCAARHGAHIHQREAGRRLCQAPLALGVGFSRPAHGHAPTPQPRAATGGNGDSRQGRGACSAFCTHGPVIGDNPGRENSSAPARTRDRIRGVPRTHIRMRSRAAAALNSCRCSISVDRMVVKTQGLHSFHPAIWLVVVDSVTVRA